jgi:hypothetical protein
MNLVRDLDVDLTPEEKVKDHGNILVNREQKKNGI